MSYLKNPHFISVGLFLFSFAFFIINLEYPKHLDFDETAYVPAAKAFLEMKKPMNLEHPPLGKELMAIGIKIFGDDSFGWRIVAVLFGSVTLVAMFWWAIAIYDDVTIALWVALLTMTNQMLYVMSRIGLLDGFMFAFIAVAMTAFTFWWRGDPRTKLLLLLTGVMLGLATACKWFAPIVIIMVLVMTWFRRDRVKFREVFLYLMVTPVLVYFLSFLPFFFFSEQHYDLREILLLQQRMWLDNAHLTQSHSYMSDWSGWAIIKRPIWFAYDPEADNPGYVRNVLFIGNPWIMWLGLLAVPFCFWLAYFKRRADAILAITFYLVFYLSWAIIPRHLTFYYYYYPAAMALGFVLASTIDGLPISQKARKQLRWGFLLMAAATFVYFFPVLSAIKVLIPTEASRTWFRSWI